MIIGFWLRLQRREHVLSIAQNKLRGDHRNYSICPPNMRRGSRQDKRGPGMREALTVSPMSHDDFKKCSCSSSLFWQLPCRFEMIPYHISILKSNTYMSCRFTILPPGMDTGEEGPGGQDPRLLGDPQTS